MKKGVPTLWNSFFQIISIFRGYCYYNVGVEKGEAYEFAFRKMEEDYYTNILMYILNYDNYKLLPLFIHKLIGNKSKDFDYNQLGIGLFMKNPPKSSNKYKYIIGIAPYEFHQDNNTLENNMDSIPDAWVYGFNFTLLFEFKIRGNLDEAQLAAHKKKLPNYKGTIRLKWSDVIEALHFIKKDGNQVQRFLIDEFIASSKDFKIRRKSSGMPKEIIGGRNIEEEIHFIITGSKDTNGYSVDIVLPDGMKKRLINSLSGIQASRKWIAGFIIEMQNQLPIDNVDKKQLSLIVVLNQEG
ncbi:hypothetical protein [Alkalihalobacillus sp. TS-13]|uniref:hypothetical protein n=1 Tax=Alkalihalobacillus sp. TS-13 TaxID=2842455 RepID=UPI001C88AC1F|nr:hypothetical protein [Alkalihalobacillus sp. TS-13]